ncbi:MAG: glycosyltransferase family 4 protein [Cyclobacteriaceae bacterium]|nr:glycosyltransferase family 4 protein [Cyclobacteriaceae bacterium]
MEINVYPHLSSARSMARYASGLIPALNQAGLAPHVIGSTENLSFWNRYPGYLLKAIGAGSFGNLILSERFSFLLTVMAKRRTVVVCHDLVTLHYKKQSFVNKLWYKTQLWFMSRARLIVCISESTRTDLLRFVPGIDPEKIKVIYNGLERSWNTDVQKHEAENNFETKYEGNKFFLMVGTDAWNKNFQGMIDQLGNINAMGYRLIKIGAISPEHLRQIQSAGMEHVVRHERHVTDDELKWLYQNAEALVFPSLHEGFGWPPLEAMACGCPVIASDRSSIPEVCGRAALYIDPTNKAKLAKALIDVANDAKLRERLIETGVIQARQFTWENTAENFKRLLASL